MNFTDRNIVADRCRCGHARSKHLRNKARVPCAGPIGVHWRFGKLACSCVKFKRSKIAAKDPSK